MVLAPGLGALPVPWRGTSCPAAQSCPAPPAPQPARAPSAGPRRPARARWFHDHERKVRA